ncbi:hypothetical protein MNB_SUP05-SYMBIONT-4-1075 [hydrothermal vent metagenome]|uniref:Type II secretion system protein GspF domain-containing protein n=1 Tax=hydrothermal vent metagenome TaxID=652676 RepID=A0A1W1E077_9ZZZZ
MTTLTKNYRVKYTVADVVASVVVAIDDSNNVDAEIAKKLGITPSQILKKSKEFGAIRQIIKEDDLLIILSTLEAVYLSKSKTLEQSLIDTVLDFYPKDRNLQQLTKIWAVKSNSITEMLSAMNVDPVIVILLESGGAGNMSQSLKEAKKYCKLSNESNKLYKTDIVPNVMFSFLAFALVLGMPFILAEPYNKIVQIKKVVAPDMIVLMNFVVSNISSIVFVLMAIIALIIFSFANERLFNQLKKIAPWRVIGDLKNLKSAMNFLPIYTTLKSIDYLDVDVVKFYQKIQKRVGGELADCMREGQSLSHAITNTSLSQRLARQLSIIFEIEDQSIKSEVAGSTIEALNAQIKKQAKKISILMLLMRNFFLLLAIIFFIGVYATGLSL